MKRNRILTTILAICMAFGLTACANQEDIDSAVTPLSEQITTINLALTEMQTLDTTLDGYIDTLETKVATLETDLSTVNTALESLEENSATKTALLETKTALESEINSIKADITALKAKNTELDGKITELETALSTEITDAEKWINDTFTTKAACDTLKTEINTSIATLQGKIDGLETSVDTLNATVTALQTQVEENTKKLEELENRINCLEGKHEAETFSYVYTLSETAPTSTKNYTCLHCGKVIEETVSPSVWSVGDKVTYVAKDGNSYVSTVGEVTDGKAVLINETVNTVEYTYDNWTDEKVLALLDNVGARYPSISEAVATLYQAATDPYVDRNNLGSVKYRYLAVYQEDTTVMYRYYTSVWNYNARSFWGSYDDRTATLYYCYVWDIPITTAE